MRTLTLPLNALYFDQIKAGTKREEYRLVTPYWAKRLAGRTYDQVTFTKGYPAASDLDRRLTLPWLGYREKTLTHPHFGPDPVEVFAIFVAPVPAESGAGVSLSGDKASLPPDDQFPSIEPKSDGLSPSDEGGR